MHTFMAEVEGTGGVTPLRADSHRTNWGLASQKRKHFAKFNAKEEASKKRIEAAFDYCCRIFSSPPPICV
jgi:hypothetical protein